MTPSELARVLQGSELRPPQTLTIAVTGSCNLTCSHCWVEAGVPASNPHLPAPSIHAIIDEFLLLGGTGIRFTGGEPLLHPDWLTFMTSARDRGYRRLSLQTNAMLLTDSWANELKRLDFPGLSLEISLDGATSSSHDQVRGKGAFCETLAGIKRLTRVGLSSRVTLFFTEMHHNLGELPDVLKLATELGVGAVASGALVRCGRAAGHGVNPATPEQYLQLLQRFKHDAELNRLYDLLGSTAAVEWWRNQAPRTECCTFVENPYLTPAGTLYPCTLCHCNDFSVTGVFRKGLTAAFKEGIPLWTSLSSISHSRSENLAECQTCPEQTFCAGGCMGRAFGSHGELLTRDDRCNVRRAIGKEKKTR